MRGLPRDVEPSCRGLTLAQKPNSTASLEDGNMISYSISMKSRVTERGQVTIPKYLRERLGIQAGQVIEFSEVEGRIVLHRQVPEHPVDRLFGILEAGPRTDALMEELRGPAADHGMPAMGVAEEESERRGSWGRTDGPRRHDAEGEG